MDVEVPDGTSILDAARIVQVRIPTHCKHPDLLPTSACGLCIVIDFTKYIKCGRCIQVCHIS